MIRCTSAQRGMELLQAMPGKKLHVHDKASIQLANWRQKNQRIMVEARADTAIADVVVRSLNSERRKMYPMEVRTCKVESSQGSV
jgi:hypothetical protein